VGKDMEGGGESSGSAPGPRGHAQGLAQRGPRGVSAGGTGLSPVLSPVLSGSPTGGTAGAQETPEAQTLSPALVTASEAARPGDPHPRFGGGPRGAGGVTAETQRKALRVPRPDRRGGEGLPSSTSPSPSWPRPPRIGRLCRGTQHHSSSHHSRPPSF
jgi:hypothetical protein